MAGAPPDPLGCPPPEEAVDRGQVSSTDAGLPSLLSLAVHVRPAVQSSQRSLRTLFTLTCRPSSDTHTHTRCLCRFFSRLHTYTSRISEDPDGHGERPNTDHCPTGGCQKDLATCSSGEMETGSCCRLLDGLQCSNYVSSVSSG